MNDTVDLSASLRKLHIMPFMDPDQYQNLRAQILANAYFLFPKKFSRIATREPNITTNDDDADADADAHIGVEELPMLQQGTTTASPHSSNASSKPISSFTDGPKWSVFTRDLEVAICQQETNDLNLEPEPAFYAIVFDKNECSGEDQDEHEAQITRQRDKLHASLVPTKIVGSSPTEEEALLSLCTYLEIQANKVLMGTFPLDKAGKSARHDTPHVESGNDSDLETRKNVKQQRHNAGNSITGSGPGTESSQVVEGHESNGMEGIEHTPSQIVNDTQEDGLNQSDNSTQSNTSSEQRRLMAPYQPENSSGASSKAFETMRSPVDNESQIHHTIPTQLLSPKLLKAKITRKGL